MSDHMTPAQVEHAIFMDTTADAAVKRKGSSDEPAPKRSRARKPAQVAAAATFSEDFVAALDEFKAAAGRWREAREEKRARMQAKRAEADAAWRPPSSYDFSMRGEPKYASLEVLGIRKELPRLRRGLLQKQNEHDEKHPVPVFINAALVEKVGEGAPQLSLMQLVTAFLLLDEQRPGLIAAWDVGLGKTLLSVLSAALQLWSGRCERVVFVVGKSLKGNFEATLQRACFPQLLEVLGLSSEAVHVVSIDDLMKQFKGMLSLKEEERAAARVAAKELLAGAFLCVDEAHNFRTYPGNDKGVRTILMLLLSTLAECRLLLTATPVANEPIDMLLLSAIAQGSLRIGTQEDFAQMLDIPAPKAQIYSRLSAYQQDEELQNVFKGIVTFLKADDPVALKPCGEDAIPDAKGDFPRVKRVKQTIELNEEQTAHYYKELENARAEAEQAGGKSGNAFFHEDRRASNTTNGAKADAVMTMIRRFLQTCDHSGFCCFSDFIGNGIDIIARLLTEAGIEFALIDGKTPKEARDSAVRRFNAGEVRVILLSRAGGEGIDLLRCKKLVIMEPTWNMSKLLQIEGRGVRRGALSYLPEAEREIEIVTLRVSLDNGEPTGDQTVAMIAMRKMPCVTAFLGRLQRLCDPLAAFRKAAAGDAVPRAAAASAVDMNRTEFAAWKVADDARFLRADGTRMSYEERKAKREADFAASRERTRNAYRERMNALRQKWRDEAKAKSRETITAAAAAAGSGETPAATALPSSAAAESEVAASAADA